MKQVKYYCLVCTKEDKKMMNTDSDDLICSTCGQGFCTFVTCDLKEKFRKQQVEEEKKSGEEIVEPSQESVFAELLFNGPSMERQGSFWVSDQNQEG